MNISSISNAISSFSIKNNVNNNKEQNKNQPSFKAIYVEDIVRTGDSGGRNFQDKFLRRDALLLNEIANLYPYQDCFIRKGNDGLPSLEYREKPPEVQIFTETLGGEYRTSVNPNDEDYPTETLMLYPDSKLNRFIGVPSYFSLNPSLASTVKAGFEVHKRLLEKKYQIMDILGKSDIVNLGEEDLISRAHEEIKDTEVAVQRLLIEEAFSALRDRISGDKIYDSPFPKVQATLEEKRRIELTTGAEELKEISLDKIYKTDFDICSFADSHLPNRSTNQARIDELVTFMYENGMGLD